ncbi:MAG: hypothetical protein Q9203_005156, partial [Teloschistes exilis]
MHLRLPLFTLIIAITTTTTTAVDITFRFPPDRWNPAATRGAQTCTSILPGHCCVPVPTYPAYDNIPSSGDAFGYRVELTHLALFHLGLAWAVNYTDTWRSTVGFLGFRIDLPGCTTRPWETRLGPGSFSIGDAPGDR